MQEIQLTQANDGESCEVHPDDVVIVRLDENPTTGYQWAVNTLDDKVLALQGSEFLPPGDPQFGEGGIRVFTFKAKTTGRAHIQLKYWQEWEGNGSIDTLFNVTAIVKE